MRLHQIGWYHEDNCILQMHQCVLELHHCEEEERQPKVSRWIILVMMSPRGEKELNIVSFIFELRLLTSNMTIVPFVKESFEDNKNLLIVNATD